MFSGFKKPETRKNLEFETKVTKLLTKVTLKI